MAAPDGSPPTRAPASRARALAGPDASDALDAADLPLYLHGLVARFERPTFIAEDPVSIPHGFEDARDREVIGLYAALLAWGRRSTMLAKLEDLCRRMRYRPAAFVFDFRLERDAHVLDGFVHRTFQPQDAVDLTRALSAVLRRHECLENAFGRHLDDEAPDVGPAIQGFSDEIMSVVEAMPRRMRKHLPRPSTGSSCKRLAMYLRWMVRPGPVDFGLWTAIQPRQLVLPLDVHTGRQARRLGLLHRRTDDWRATLELTEACRRLAPHDPARFDFALFGAGVHDVDHPRALVQPNAGPR